MNEPINYWTKYSIRRLFSNYVQYSTNFVTNKIIPSTSVFYPLRKRLEYLPWTRSTKEDLSFLSRTLYNCQLENWIVNGLPTRIIIVIITIFMYPVFWSWQLNFNWEKKEKPWFISIYKKIKIIKEKNNKNPNFCSNLQWSETSKSKKSSLVKI